MGGDGALEWTDLPAGLYNVGVHGEVAKSLRQRRDQAVGRLIERQVALPPAGSLHVEVADAAERRFAEPLPMVELRRQDGGPTAMPMQFFADVDPSSGIVHRLQCQSGGIATFQALPAGACRVTASRHGFQPATEFVEVVRGEGSRLRILLARE